MAKVRLVQTGEGPLLIYSVDAAVGPNAPNRRDDALLVQYFLREIFKGPDFKADPFPRGQLAVDGKVGPDTFAAILHFQQVAKRRGHHNATDGRVDPPGEQHYGPILKTVYTIINMNTAFKASRPQDYPKVSKASDCPAELRLYLREPEFV